jgi:hypothetical protein
MNPSLLGAITALLLGMLWWSGRTRRPLQRSIDAAAVAALNRAQIAFRQTEAHPRRSGDGSGAFTRETRSDSGAGPAVFGGRSRETGVPRLPVTERERRAFLTLLNGWCQGGGSERLRAMAALQGWGHRDALPLLRRGLRDPHPAVMLEAARAMEAYRGKASVAAPLQGQPGVHGWDHSWDQPRALPRNVARTR